MSAHNSVHVWWCSTGFGGSCMSNLNDLYSYCFKSFNFPCVISKKVED